MIQNENKYFRMSIVFDFNIHLKKNIRDVAQPGSALHWGCSGRRFKSGHPDQSQFKISFVIFDDLKNTFLIDGIL